MEYKNLRNQYLNIFAREVQELEKVKKILAEERIAETYFIKDKRYRRTIVYAFEQIGFMFSTHNVKFFTDCDYFGRGMTYGRYEPCNNHRNHKSKQYFDDEDVVKKLSSINQLKKELGNAFLISDERQRVNKITVLHKDLSSVYFTEIEEDVEIRMTRYATANAAKALFPYKRFIFEVLNAQRKISQSEADQFLIKSSFNACINKMIEWFGNKRTQEGRVESCKTRFKEKPHEYYHLDDYVVGKTLIKFLESYKDFGVNENE